MLMLLLLAQTTYYVDANGDDANPGTDVAPWETLQQAADTVAPGDTVIVRAGMYAGMHLETSGTAGAEITFRGEGAVVDTDNDTTPDGINLEGASYVVVEGFTVMGVTRAGIRAVLCSNVVIRNNVLDQNGRWGVLTGFCDDVLIENNQAVALSRRARHLRLQQRRSTGHPRQPHLRKQRQRHPHERRHLAGGRRRHLQRAGGGEPHLGKRRRGRLRHQLRRRAGLDLPEQRHLRHARQRSVVLSDRRRRARDRQPAAEQHHRGGRRRPLGAQRPERQHR